MRIPEAPLADDKNEESESIEPEDITCSRCKMLKHSMQAASIKPKGWLATGLLSAYEKLRGYVVTQRVKKHA